MFSDYSPGRGEHRTYSFLVTTMSEMMRFNRDRLEFRTKNNLQDRRISFKGLNDKIKRLALPKFLNLAGKLSGFLLTFAVDSGREEIFADVFLEAWPELSGLKRATLEDLLRVAHFGAISLLLSTHDSERMCWFTDEDNIVANETLQQRFGKISQAALNMMYADSNAPAIAFATTAIDNGTFDLEDLIAIPDLMAGAMCELLDQMGFEGTCVTNRLGLRPPQVTSKTDLICAWAAEPHNKLSKFAISIQRSDAGNNWSPTFFSIQQHPTNLYSSHKGFGS